MRYALPHCPECGEELMGECDRVGQRHWQLLTAEEVPPFGDGPMAAAAKRFGIPAYQITNPHWSVPMTTTTIRLTAKLKATKEQEARATIDAAMTAAGITGTVRRVECSKRGNGSLYVSAVIIDPTGDHDAHLAVSKAAKEKGVSLAWGVTEGAFTSIHLMYPWTGPRSLR